MGLSNSKEEQIRKMPLLETRIFKSKDGRFIVHKTIQTDIKPFAYYEAVLNNEPLQDGDSAVEKIEESVEA